MSKRACELLDGILVVAQAMREQEPAQRLDSYAALKAITEELIIILNDDEKAEDSKTIIGVIGSAAWVIAQETHVQADSGCFEMIQIAVAALKEQTTFREDEKATGANA